MTRKTKYFETWCKDNNRDDLLEEWYVDKNLSLRFPQNTSDVKYNNPSIVYWKCQENHEWETSVVSRTIFKLQCPICHPEESVLPVGAKYGCLTITGDFEEYRKEIAYPRIVELEQDKANLLQGIRKENTNITSPESYDSFINNYKNREVYKCQCKCGQTQYVDEFRFLEKKHRYCTQSKNECELRKKHRESRLASFKREYHESYDIDYLNSIHESLEIIECVDDKFEKLHSWQDKRKRGGRTYKIYKKYKCRCYLCGREQIVISSDLSINPSTAYGHRAYRGYYSEACCDCHKISSFQWIVTKVLVDNKVPYRVEISFQDLYGTKGVNLLRYDFSILNPDGSIKCLIECQGEQHFESINEFGGIKQFERQQLNDKLKRTYAYEKGIPLYEIPYTSKKYENVILFLKSEKII